MDILSPTAFGAAIRLLAAFLLLGLAPARAQEPTEYQVKGAYLLKFIQYVEGFKTSGSQAAPPFVIGILGDDPFDGLLAQLAQNRTYQGRPIVIRHFKRAEEIRDVQLLYLGPAGAGHWNQALADLRGQGLLTVTDGNNQTGAVIHFVLRANKVRFEIDADAANRAELKLSSKLLSLATSIKYAGPNQGR